MLIQCQLRKCLKIITEGQRLFLEKRIFTGSEINSSAVIYFLFSCPEGLSDSSSFKETHRLRKIILCTTVKLQDPVRRVPVTLGGNYMLYFRT